MSSRNDLGGLPAKLLLDNVRVASPCNANWDEMAGDDRVRHCRLCKLDVYNLSDMSRDEAQTLIAARNGRLCVRYFQRTDGTMLLKDCTLGKARRRTRVVLAAGVAALLGGQAYVAFAFTRTAEDKAPEFTACAIPDVTHVREVAHEPPTPPPHVADDPPPPPPPPPPLLGKLAIHPVMGDIE
jgi:hypothetical protein